jgi:uncharacterized protein YkwD
MNPIDLLLLAYVGLYTAFRFRRGAISLSLELAGLLASIAVALLGYGMLSTWLDDFMPEALSRAASFVLLLILAETVLFTLIRILTQTIPTTLRGSPLNRWLGLAPAAANGIVLAAILLTIAYGLPLPQNVRDQLASSAIGRPLIDKTGATVEPIFGEALRGLMNTLTQEPPAGERIELGFTATKVKEDERAERRMWELLNQERASRGIAPVALETGPLREVARAHSRDMFARGYFAHENPDGKSPFDRMREGGVSFRTAGENLAYAPDVEIAHEGLMNSPPHKKNILDPDFRRVGIGAISAGWRGTMFTQNFTN